MASVLVAAVLLAIMPFSMSLPFVLFHGIGKSCSSFFDKYTLFISSLSGSRGYCIEIGNGEYDSRFMPMSQQATIACEKVKQMRELRQGYNIVGLSQGNMVARGLIQLCDGGPPVRNYVSIAGPHAGITSLPPCWLDNLCGLSDRILKLGVYTEYVQDHFAYSGFVKFPNFEHDRVLIPKESAWFGYYPDGDFMNILPPHQTKLYIEDWIGLKTLVMAGKVKFISIPTEHEQMKFKDTMSYVVPYLKD